MRSSAQVYLVHLISRVEGVESPRAFSRALEAARYAPLADETADDAAPPLSRKARRARRGRREEEEVVVVDARACVWSRTAAAQRLFGCACACVLVCMRVCVCVCVGGRNASPSLYFSPDDDSSAPRRGR